MKSDIHVAQQDTMRVAPQRAAQLASKRANGESKRYTSAPTCGNPQCAGLCYLCSADSSSTGMTPDEDADQHHRLGKAIVRAHRHAARHSATPAIVKRAAPVSYEQENRIYAAFGRTSEGRRNAEREIKARNEARRTEQTVLRTAAGERDKVRRARLGAQAQRDAATFRRMMSADERRDPSVSRIDGADGRTVRIPS